MTRLAAALVSFFLLCFFVSWNECHHDYQWESYGGSGTREFRALIDNHPFFDGKFQFNTTFTTKFTHIRFDKSSRTVNPKSLVSVNSQYMYLDDSDSVYINLVKTGANDVVNGLPSLVSVLTVNGSAHLSYNETEGKVSIHRISPAQEQRLEYSMADGFNWSTMTVSGDVIPEDLSLAYFTWGNELDNKTLLINFTAGNHQLGQPAPFLWPRNRADYLVWHENATDLLHTIRFFPSANSTFTLRHTVIPSYITQWDYVNRFIPTCSLYHTKAESLIFADSEGIKSLAISNGAPEWSFPATSVKQMAASYRGDNVFYLYFSNNTHVTFLRFDATTVTLEATYAPSTGDQINAISVLHGSQDNEELIFVSGTSSGFYVVTTDGIEVSQTPGYKCLSPVIFQQESQFLCADSDGIRVFKFEGQPAPSDGGGGLAAGWIALIVIGSVLAVVLLLGIAYYLYSSSSKKSGPEMIF